MLRIMFISLVIFASVNSNATPLFIEKVYDSFKVVIDCRNRGAIAYEMTLGTDQGDIARLRDFKIDPTIPIDCQMTTGGTFKVTDSEEALFGKFQRGHLADANSLDNSEQSMIDSFFVTNMLPQAARFNMAGGAWRRTEQITECYREISDLHIWGGVIWGDDASNDLFVDTHNVITPDRWWKVIYMRDTNTYIAWIFNNDQNEKRSVMNDRIVTLDELKQEISFVPDFGDAEHGVASTATWKVEGSDPLRCIGVEADSG